MAKSANKKTTRPKKNKFGVVMTTRLRLFLIGCFFLGFIAVAIIYLRG
jgi:hypothetical protein